MHPNARILLMRAASNATHAVRLRCTSDDYPAAMMCVDNGLFTLQVSDAGSKFTLTADAHEYLAKQGYKPAPFKLAAPTAFLDAIGLADFEIMSDADITELRKYVGMWRKARSSNGSIWHG